MKIWYRAYRKTLHCTSEKWFLALCLCIAVEAKKLCQKFQWSRACLLSWKTHYWLVPSLQCPPSLNTKYTTLVACRLSSLLLPLPRPQPFHVYWGWLLFIAGCKKNQIARLLQKCKTGHSMTLPLQLLRLFVCWVLIGDEFGSACIHAVIWKQLPLWLIPITYLSGNIILQFCDMQSGKPYASLNTFQGENLDHYKTQTLSGYTIWKGCMGLFQEIIFVLKSEGSLGGLKLCYQQIWKQHLYLNAPKTQKHIIKRESYLALLWTHHTRMISLT